MMEPLPRVSDMLQYFETILPSVENLWSSKQDEVHSMAGGATGGLWRHQQQEGILYVHVSLSKFQRSIFCELFMFTISICGLFSGDEWRILGATFHKRVP